MFMENTNAVVTEKRDRARSIDEALEVLTGAAESGSENIREMVQTECKRIRSVLTGSWPNHSRRLHEIRAAATEQVEQHNPRAQDSIREAVDYIDRSARRNAWYFVGGAAMLIGVTGYILGSKRTRH
jgi:uncharacterized protein YicC (UPF0701 family)